MTLDGTYNIDVDAQGKQVFRVEGNLKWLLAPDSTSIRQIWFDIGIEAPAE